MSLEKQRNNVAKQKNKKQKSWLDAQYTEEKTENAISLRDLQTNIRQKDICQLPEYSRMKQSDICDLFKNYPAAGDMVSKLNACHANIRDQSSAL